MNAGRGIVYLVGAGPGAPDLITVRGRELLRRADVVVFDRLVDPRLIDQAGPRARRIDAGKAPGRVALTQEEINARLIAEARAGNLVVRLKGGDAFIFGRGGEELTACRAAGVACIVVPGVTSAAAAPASVGIPLTQRGVARSFAVITAEGGAELAPPAHDFAALTHIDTLVVLMGRASMAEWTQALIAAGKPADTPAACIASATTARQQTVTAPLAKLAEAVEQAGLAAPVVTVIGEVVRGVQGDAVRSILPLAGRRVVLTGAHDTNRRFMEILNQRGAIAQSFPLIRIVYPPASDELRSAVQRLTQYAWVVFTSRHAVRAFFSAVRAAHLDARALARCRVAAVGDGTARTLRRWGVWPDLVPRVHTADGLADALSRWVEHERVLYPRSNLARDTLATRLIRDGAIVDDLVAYRTEENADGAGLARVLRGEDASIVLASPSAARALARSRAGEHVSAIAAIGPVTADAARAVGLRVACVAPTPTPEGVASALEEYWVRAEVSR